MTDTIPSLGFDSNDLPAGTAYDAWAKLTPGYEPGLPDGAAAADFGMSGTAWLLGSLTVTAGSLSPMRLTRRTLNIGADRRDNYNFLLLTSGSWRGDPGGGVEVQSGEICVVDFATTWAVETTRNEHIMVIVPRRAIAERCPAAVPLHGRKLEGPTGRLLAAHFSSLAKFLPTTPMHEAALVEEATLHLLASAVNAAVPDDAPPSGTPRIDRDVATRVGDFIDQNLSRAELSVDLICRSLGIARSSLYRAFDAAGGVAVLIQRRRLELAHAMLADPLDTTPTAAISELFCFSSPAWFSTAFRRHFGYSPRDVRRLSGPVASASEFRHWMQWLAREIR